MTSEFKHGINSKGEKKSKFEDMPQIQTNLHYLGSLVYEYTFPDGSTTTHDFSKHTHAPALARDFVAALEKYRLNGGLYEKASFHNYYTNINEVLAFCEKNGYPATMRMKDIDSAFLEAYQANLLDATLHFKGDAKRDRYATVRRLLVAGKKIGLWPADVKIPRNFPCAADADRTSPYMSSEMTDLEDALRREFDEICERLERGKELLKIGVNPRQKVECRDSVTGKLVKAERNIRPWSRIENAIWYVVNVLDCQYLSDEQLKNGHSSFVKACKKGMGGNYSKQQVYAHLYPTNKDMAVIVSLLVKKLFIPLSSVLTLLRDDLVPFEDGFILNSIKLRSKGHERQPSRIYKDDGPYSGIGLLRRVQSITEPLVRFARDADKNRLTLCLTAGSQVGVPVKPLDMSYGTYLMNGSSGTDGWAQAVGIKDQHGDTLKVHTRRIRVTNSNRAYSKSGNYKHVKSQMVHASGDTTACHYLTNDGNKWLHDKAIVAAQKSARDVSRPRVLPNDDISKAAKELKVNKEKAKAILNGEQDVFIAACADFMNCNSRDPI